MTTVETIRYTAHPEAWHALAADLGLVPVGTPNPGWTEFAGDGLLAIHALPPGSVPRAELHLLVDDLAEAERAARAAGFATERRMLDDAGELVVVTAASGATLSLGAGVQPAAAAGAPTVQAIWYQPDGDEIRRVLEALGLRSRIASDSGTWVDYRADAGSAAFHADAGVRVEAALDFAGDLDALAERLVAAGRTASVHDEAYNRTLLVTTPDGDALWINGAQDDLYGFHREE